MGSSRNRARTCVPCIGRRILNHCTTREAPKPSFKEHTFTHTHTRVYVYYIFFESHTSRTVAGLKPTSSGSSPPPPQHPCTLLGPPPWASALAASSSRDSWPGQLLLASQPSGRPVSPPERGQCPLLHGRVQTGLLIRTSARSGQDLPLCAESVVSPRVRHVVAPGQDARSKWTSEPNRPALPAGVGGD